MIKTVMPGDYDWHDQQSLLIESSRTGIDVAGLKKRAAVGVFKDNKIVPAKGHSIIHLIAMGDSEKYGANRNGDIFYREGHTVEFPEPKSSKSVVVQCGNKDRAWTFEKYAKVYRDHKNGKQDKVCGSVIKAAHNDKMSRIELLVSVPHDDPVWRDDMQKLAEGEDIPFSMSCRVPGDYCSICGNFAPTRKQYCEHLRKNMTELTKSGHRVGMINDHMVYFDISRVRVPADRIAYSLMKVANYSKFSEEERNSHEFYLPAVGVDADPTGLFICKNSDLLNKLAKIEKTVEAVGRLPVAGMSMLPDVMPSLPESAVRILSEDRARIGDVLQALADVKISLSLSDLMHLILGPRAGGVSGSIRIATDMLPGMFSRMSETDIESLPESVMPACGNPVLPERVMDVVRSLKADMSLDADPVKRRVMLVVVRGMPAPELKKSACLVDETAERMLDIYMAYKVAWCTRRGVDSSEVNLALLQHYI